MGRLIDGITVADTCFKNRNFTKTTSAIVNNRVIFTSCMDSIIDKERSFTSVNCIESGICAYSDGSKRLMELTTSTVLAFGCLLMPIAMDLSPFEDAKVFTSS